MNGLFNSSTLEMALGLIFIYFLLSIICSSINEFFAGLLKWRARDLEYGLKSLLQDQDIVNNLLNHPLVSSVSTRKTEAVAIRFLAGEKAPKSRSISDEPAQPASDMPLATGAPSASKANGIRKDYAGKPSYIPARTFVLALLDIIASNGETPAPFTIETIRAKATELAQRDDSAAKALGKTLLLLLDDSKGTGQITIGVNDIIQLVEALPSSPERDNLLATIRPLTSITEIRNAMLSLPVGNARQAVLDFLNTGLSEIEAFKKRVEGWYDTAMEGVRGVYKRRVQIYLFAFGLFTAAFIGADTLYIANALATSASVRQAVLGDVGRATTPGGDFYLNQSATDSPTTSTISSTVAITSTGNVTSTTTTVTLPSTSSVLKELNSFGQLFGYDVFRQQWDNNANTASRIGLILWKGLGLLITAFAISFGAPFWFDILNKVANLRAAIKPADDQSAP